MYFEIEINHKPVKVRRGETILEVLNRIGIAVPTLCSMKEFVPTGMCRLCVVELEGKEMLIPSCSFKVEEWMKIQTHSPRVILARKTIIELLLANHPDDCLYCERNGNCELQKHAEDMHVRERRIIGNKNKSYIDRSSNAIIHDPDKCILCGRCIRICSEKVGISTWNFTHRGIKTSVQTALNQPINSSNCVFCGQCIMICPTAALSERINFSEMQVYFHAPNKKMAACYSPAIVATLAEKYNLKNNSITNAVINTILRRIGFEIVFDTSFATDMMITEMCGDFLTRLKKNENFPMLSSNCPSWVKYIEQTYPQYIKNLSTVKSPSQLSGIYVKYIIAKQKSLLPDDIHLVSILPCTAAKFEASRPQMTIRGVSDVDTVITIREFLRMIKMYGIDVENVVSEIKETFQSNSSMAGMLVNISGGTTEMFLRSLHYHITGKNPSHNFIFPKLINKGIKEFDIKIGDYKFSIAIVNGLIHVKELLEKIENRQTDLHFVEVMTCINGCIGGGGYQISRESDAWKKNYKCLQEWAENYPIAYCHENIQLPHIYREYLGSSLPSNYHEWLHTNYIKREVLI